MSVLHRVDDMWSMPADRFVRMVERLPYYPGVIRERAMAQHAGTRAEPDAMAADDLELMDFADVIDM
ncbi:MAG TPA: hypothetical protein VIS06_12585 [Mycobacteriales bacterium]